MKVGTDGVLLGAWVNVEEVNTVLDVGTGTGLIALMIAQRCSATITGIEIEKNAADEARFNAASSPWASRITIEKISFQEFSKNCRAKFDLIISNPPFFINDKKSKDINLAIAKHNDLLPFDDLLNGSKKLLSPNGKLAVILPEYQAKQLVEKAREIDLFLIRITTVKPSPQKKPNRYLLENGKKNKGFENNSFSIFCDENNHYSSPYINLTKDFYLNF